MSISLRYKSQIQNGDIPRLMEFLGMKRSSVYDLLSKKDEDFKSSEIQKLDEYFDKKNQRIKDFLQNKKKFERIIIMSQRLSKFNFDCEISIKKIETFSEHLNNLKKLL